MEIEKLSAQQKKQLIKRHPTEQEKTFVSSPSYRGLKARIFQKFRKQTTRNQTAQSTNRLMKLTNSSQKRKYKCLLNMKRWGGGVYFTGYQRNYISTAWRAHLPPVRMAFIKKANNMLAKGQRGPLITAGRDVNL